MLQNYLLTVMSFAILGAGCVVCLCLALSLKEELRRLRAQVNKQDQQSKLTELDQRLQQAEENHSIPAPVAIRPGLNINKRAQVLRMSRRGEGAETIAAALSVPRRQVDLLLKINAIALSGAGKTTS
jgi:hypothetical protein